MAWLPAEAPGASWLGWKAVPLGANVGTKGLEMEPAPCYGGSCSEMRVL